MCHPRANNEGLNGCPRRVPTIWLPPSSIAAHGSLLPPPSSLFPQARLHIDHDSGTHGQGQGQAREDSVGECRASNPRTTPSPRGLYPRVPKLTKPLLKPPKASSSHTVIPIPPRSGLTSRGVQSPASPTLSPARFPPPSGQSCRLPYLFQTTGRPSYRHVAPRSCSRTTITTPVVVVLVLFPPRPPS